ncbi:leucine-rich repeat protein [uncultured Senegalimassilia sp.]|uniref:leucine-rich repeat protein n=1 Tax=uncultured Senegalimassilia sp. TaxID=1714350 RepID=UPI0025CF5253|nr:leucine-rich repeat protein [uncultured Senegalimassilia sp.]
MGAERRSRAGGYRSEMAQRRARASRSGVCPWRAVWRCGTAVALSCILAAGLVPVAGFAQGSETIAAARESLRANASGAAADGAGNAGDAANGYAAGGTGDAADAGGAAANSADGGLLVVGSQVEASGEGPAAAPGAQGSQSAQSSQGSQVGAGADSSAAGGLAGDAGDAAGTGSAADPAPDPDANDPGPAPDYDGTEAAYVYDDYYGEYLLATAKGITGDKADGDVGYVAGTATPAQVWLTLDEKTNELTVHHVDAGAVAFGVPATVDGRPITTVGGCGSSNLTSVTFPADSHVTYLSWGAFSGSQLQSIALPSSLEALGENVFSECEKLQTVEWPKNNDMLKTIPAETFAGCNMLDDSVVASIPASVETIDYRAFANCSPRIFVQGETPESFTEVNVPGTVKAIESSAFEGCEHVRSISIGDGVQTIGNRAFASMPLMAGAEVVLPASVRTMGQDAFDNTQVVSRPSGTEWKRNAVTLRVLNPDFELVEYEYGGTLEIDGKKYDNPFSVGQTIVAFARSSAGQPSWIKRAADAVAGREDEHNPGKPAYTFQWMEESSQVTGKVPAGAQVTLFQNGVATTAKVSADGSFTVEALSSTPATLQVSLEGCYD